MPQAAKLGYMYIADSGAPQFTAQRFTIELRITARSRDCTDVDNAFDAMSAEQVAEFQPRMNGMADGEDRER